MFIAQPWDYAGYTLSCQNQFGLTPIYDFVFDYFGGKDVMRDFKHASNIIFSNGQLDPWRAGGLTKQVNNDITIIIIEGAAHHLDLRSPNPQDPATVIAARQLELDTIW